MIALGLVVRYQIAKQLALERYALVFGLNMFVALVLGSLLTFIVVDSRALNTPANIQVQKVLQWTDLYPLTRLWVDVIFFICLKPVPHLT